jgi:hypothetical protein
MTRTLPSTNPWATRESWFTNFFCSFFNPLQVSTSHLKNSTSFVDPLLIATQTPAAVSNKIPNQSQTPSWQRNAKLGIQLKIVLITIIVSKKLSSISLLLHMWYKKMAHSDLCEVLKYNRITSTPSFHKYMTAKIRVKKITASWFCTCS